MCSELVCDTTTTTTTGLTSSITTVVVDDNDLAICSRVLVVVVVQSSAVQVTLFIADARKSPVAVGLLLLYWVALSHYVVYRIFLSLPVSRRLLPDCLSVSPSD